MITPNLPKRTAKNSVFLDLFQDKKNLYNDLGIMARNNRLLLLLEAQSSWTVNILFCKVFDEQRKLYGMTEQTVKETIRICKDRNILKEYLISRVVKVVTIMMSLFDDEQIVRTYVKDMAREATKRNQMM